jgi:hypothetical protein
MLLLGTHAAHVKAAIVVIGFAIATLQGVAAPKSSAWSAPVHLGAVVNSNSNEQGPTISRNGLSLFFGSARADGSLGDLDIWVSQRGCIADPWSAPVNVLALNSTAFDALPSLSPDEHWMFFTSTRLGGSGSADLWAAYRADRHNDFGWEPPVNLGPGVNSAVFDAAPELTRKRGQVGPLLYFARGANIMAPLDIYVSEVAADGSFGAPLPVAELNSAASDARVSVRRDGLELFFYSNRPGSGLNDLWTSVRQRITDPWSAPVNVGAPVNTPSMEMHPELSWDRRTLYFVSNRPGGSVGNLDLWMTTRTELDGNDQPRGCEEEGEEEGEEEEEEEEEEKP